MRRVAAWAALLFVVVNVVCIALSGSTPMPDDPISKVGEFYSDKHDNLQIQVILLGLMGVLFVFVLAELWRTLRDEDKARGEAFAVVGLAGGILVGVAATVNNVVNGAMVITVDSSSPETFGALWALLNASSGAFGSGAFLFFVGFGIAAAKSRALPSWTIYLGYLSGVLGLLATVALSSAGSFGFYATIGMFLFMLLWFLSVAISWLRTGEPA